MALKFGTAGVRAFMGEGEERLNEQTVSRLAWAAARVLAQIHGEGRRVTVAYDTRQNSLAFAQVTAAAFAKQGFEVFIFSQPAPTPLLSFTIRQLGCVGGVNITASHNPKEYNGFKLYGPQGAQVGEDVSRPVAEKWAGGKSSTQEDFWNALSEGRIHWVGAEIWQGYFRAVLALRRRRENVKTRVLYSPLFGTGQSVVPTLFRQAGIDLRGVKSQLWGDGSFPGLEVPNPEEPDAFIQLLNEADDEHLLLATDPDADRLGAVWNGEENYEWLSGNQIGLLLLDYLLRFEKDPSSCLVVKSVVSTPLADRICLEHGVSCINTLTGFRHVTEAVDRLADKRLLLAFEESGGFLAGDYCREKDAAAAALLLAEAADYHLRRSYTLPMALEELYRTYGFAWDDTTVLRVNMEGDAYVQHLRDHAPAVFRGYPIDRREDYAQRCDPLRSNMLAYYSGRTRLLIRPSGTEPAVKIYKSIM
ncbi:MAG: hypothetical protein IKD06_04050 [Clostridia bacterium]|nr:hypothetical protein [Clostridia bacterium]